LIQNATIGGSVPGCGRIYAMTSETSEPPETAPHIRVADSPDASRFEVTVDGELAGYAAYERAHDQLRLTHTVVDPAFEGRGLAGRLAKAAMQTAEAGGLAVVPQCPYMRSWLLKHEEYVVLVPEKMRPAFGLA
jgi:predicted GNAT family acetyltransferase